MRTDKAVKARGSAKRSNWWIYAILGLLAVIALFPFIWEARTSLMTRVDAFAVPPILKFRPIFSTYAQMLIKRGMWYNFLNTVICSVSATVLSISLGSLAAYSFARFEFKGKDSLAFWILSNRMIPPVALVLPIFVMYQKMNLLDTRLGLVILYTAMQLPFVIWIMESYFEEIPAELEEAAMIDGASWFQVLTRITLPLAVPSIIATAIFVLILNWNEFPFALILTSTKAKTLPPAVMTFMDERNIHWNEVAAATMIISVPIIVFGFLFQKRLVRGWTMGAFK